MRIIYKIVKIFINQISSTSLLLLLILLALLIIFALSTLLN